MGAFIGEALGLGPHWYYDLEELRRDYGDWITTYTDPKPGRYHEGLKAGQLSQPGLFSSSCCIRLSSRAAMTKRISADAWMKSCFPCWTVLR
ncbi:ADP-ribosylglycohydrolase family protein [Nitrosospira multiformis]|nr:ADP-ribosylglycohydrolase family protein [Nitrosospira multiformis]